jgi:heme-degrading monooxygenase HmoA
MIIAVGTRSILPGKEAEWERLWAQMHELARSRPGFRSARLLKSTEHGGKYTMITEWDSEQGWNRLYEEPEMQALTRQSFALFKGAPVQEWHTVLHEVTASEPVQREVS